MKDKKIYRLKDLSLENKRVVLNEAIFHNANGYIGVRYDFEEGYPDGYQITRSQYINGFYDYAEMPQAEKLYGLPETKQVMLNVADTQEIRVFLEGEQFSMYSGTLLDYKLYLDMDHGVTVREVKWRSPKGKEVHIKITRMASLHQLPLFLIEYQIKPLNFSGEIIIQSAHNGNVSNYADEKDPRTPCAFTEYLTPVSCELKDGASYITSRTSVSGLEICSSVKNILSQHNQSEFIIENNRAVCVMKATAEKGKEIKLTKYAVFCDSIRYEDCRLQALEEMNLALSVPIDYLHHKQRGHLHSYWQNCFINIEGDDELEVAMLYNMYQLNQSVSKDSFGNIAPKGLSGDGYEGQYFWDSETYIQPFFTITNPADSKILIESRFLMLEHARINARILGHKKGALYAWRTITGQESSGYFPAGSAQYHINGAVAYSIIAYYLATKDINFVAEKGAEILFETARLWIDTGNFYHGEFHINDVTGPDEYTCIVNNNYYTNVLAQYHLRWAVKFYTILKEAGLLDPVAKKIKLKMIEIRQFIKAAEAMYLPYDKDRKINPQDDSFLQKKTWDMSSIPRENFPLLLHYHPLHLYRHQICKQADTVLAYFMLEDAQSIETMRNSFRYYEKITTHDSSLSPPIYSIVAARLGLEERAYQYFGDSAKMDLWDLHHNTKDGIHTANMAGTFLTIVYGFGGFRLKEQGISFWPILPAKWKKYSFKILFENSRIDVTVTELECILTLEKGKCKTVRIYGKQYCLEDRLIVKRPARSKKRAKHEISSSYI
jgi:alpha,alpha-trehalose phosphorylase